MHRSLVLEHLAQAERHILQGEDHIANQLARIEEAERAGLNAGPAKSLLRTLEESQALHLAERERLRAELDGAV
jgi:hypothetical protein